MGAEIRGFLIEHGVPVELIADLGIEDYITFVCDQASELVREVLTEGFVYDDRDKTHYLILPPDRDFVLELLQELHDSDPRGENMRVAKFGLIAVIEESAGTAPAATLYSEYETPDEDGTCLRSPCSPSGFAGDDPKVDKEQVVAALKDVGKAKRNQQVKIVKHRNRPDEVKIEPWQGKQSHVPGGGKWPLTVAYGLGVDSTAILVGLVQLWRKTRDTRWIPKVITFADTGSEKPSTYSFLRIVDEWLVENDFPPVTVVAWSTRNTARGWGTGVNLEISVLNNHTLPSISYKTSPKEIGGKAGQGHSCSLKFKIYPQSKYLEAKVESGDLEVPIGGRVIRAIGYDASEPDRLVKRSTYSGQDDEASGLFKGWYPLIEWDWDRARCIAEIAAEFGSKKNPAWEKVPPKSACFYCGASKPIEIAALPKDLLKRAIFIEQVAIRTDRPHVLDTEKIKGLGTSFSWTDFARGYNLGRSIRAVIIHGGVMRKSKRGWIAKNIGPVDAGYKPSSDERVYYTGTGVLLTARELKDIQDKADRFIDASPATKEGDDGAVVGTLFRTHIPAYRETLGFRGTRRIDYSRLQELTTILQAKVDEAKGKLASERTRAVETWKEKLADAQEKYADVEILHEMVEEKRRPVVRKRNAKQSAIPIGISLFGGSGRRLPVV